MAETNIGRVQGAGVFFSSGESSTTVALADLTPTSIHPLVGDVIYFENGNIRSVLTVSNGIVTCGDVVATIGISIISATITEV